VSGYNEAKLEILSILEEVYEGSARALALQLGRTHESVGMALFRYHQWGLVSRYNAEGRTKVYQLTERGQERLKWLRTQHATARARECIIHQCKENNEIVD